MIDGTVTVIDAIYHGAAPSQEGADKLTLEDGSFVEVAIALKAQPLWFLLPAVAGGLAVFFWMR